MALEAQGWNPDNRDAISGTTRLDDLARYNGV